MRFAIVAGPPGSGKTSLLLHALAQVRAAGIPPGVFKLDALSTSDRDRFEARGFPADCHTAGDVCPDHEAMVVLGRAWEWARGQRLGLLVFETAGLCDRCSPFLKKALAVCVASGLAGVRAPAKMRTMVETADLLVLTRAELISHAERQILLGTLQKMNPRAQRLTANGLTGEGTHLLAAAMMASPDVRLMETEPLRSLLPTGYCHFCQGGESGHA